MGLSASLNSLRRMGTGCGEVVDATFPQTPRPNGAISNDFFQCESSKSGVFQPLAALADVFQLRSLTVVRGAWPAYSIVIFAQTPACAARFLPATAMTFEP